MQTCEIAVAGAGAEEEDEGGGVLGSFSLPDFSISLLPINHIHQLLNNQPMRHTRPKRVLLINKNLPKSNNQIVTDMGQVFSNLTLTNTVSKHIN